MKIICIRDINYPECDYGCEIKKGEIFDYKRDINSSVLLINYYWYRRSSFLTLSKYIENLIKEILND